MSGLADEMQGYIAQDATAQAGSLSGEMQSYAAPPPRANTAPVVAGGTPESDWDNFLVGVGKGAVDVGRGAKQLIDQPAVWLEKKFPGISEWSQEKLGMSSASNSAAATQRDIETSRELDKPIMDTKAGMAGDVTGNLAATLLPLGAAARFSPVAGALLNPTTYKAAAAAGALQGAIQPTTQDESRLTNTAAGGVLGFGGNAAVNAVGRIAQPVQNVLSDARAKAVSVLQNAGVNLDAAQQSGSPILNRIKSGFSDNPLTSGPLAQQNATQQVAYNRAVLGTIGEGAEAATPDVMQRAQQRINGVFSDVLSRNNVGVDDSTLARIAVIQHAANEDQKTPISSIANRIIGAVGPDGTIPGQIAYGIKKDLDRSASSADSTLAYHARQLKSTLMDAINESLPPDDQAAFAQARGQFVNMKQIEGTVDKDGNGDISPLRLANVINQKANRNSSVYGNGPQDLNDLARAGSMLLRDKTPNSGTAARLVTQYALPAMLGGAGGAYDGGLKGAGIGAAAGVVAPRGGQLLMNNPAVAAYLSRGISNVAARNTLLLPQTNAAVGGGLRRLPDLLWGVNKTSQEGAQ
jgi:hypothetical protein